MLEFQSTTLSAVKSISQRSLALAWSRAAHRRKAFPRFAEFKPSNRAHDPKYLTVWRVVRKEAGYEFESLYQGDHIVKAFKRCWQGQAMSDVVPDALRAVALATTTYCATNGRAVYMIYRSKDARDKRIDCERLLLPFGDAVAGVQQIVVSMEPFSAEGDIQLSDALDNFAKAFEIEFCGSFGPVR